MDNKKYSIRVGELGVDFLSIDSYTIYDRVELIDHYSTGAR
jgi:hypothetical protein